DGIRDFHVTGVQTCALPISGTSITMSEEVFSLNETTSTFPGRIIDVTLSKLLPINFKSPPLKAGEGPKLFNCVVLPIPSSSLLRSEERRVGTERSLHSRLRP